MEKQNPKPKQPTSKDIKDIMMPSIDPVLDSRPDDTIGIDTSTEDSDNTEKKSEDSDNTEKKSEDSD